MEQARLLNRVHVSCIAIGIDSADTEEIKAIASNTRSAFKLANFDALITAVRNQTLEQVRTFSTCVCKYICHK